MITAAIVIVGIVLPALIGLGKCFLWAVDWVSEHHRKEAHRVACERQWAREQEAARREMERDAALRDAIARYQAQEEAEVAEQAAGWIAAAQRDARFRDRDYCVAHATARMPEIVDVPEPYVEQYVALQANERLRAYLEQHSPETLEVIRGKFVAFDYACRLKDGAPLPGEEVSRPPTPEEKRQRDMAWAAVKAEDEARRKEHALTLHVEMLARLRRTADALIAQYPDLREKIEASLQDIAFEEKRDGQATALGSPPPPQDPAPSTAPPPQFY